MNYYFWCITTRNTPINNNNYINPPTQYRVCHQNSFDLSGHGPLMVPCGFWHQKNEKQILAILQVAE